ncbi:hypothetical protein D9M70_650420 [compost metagenome]
MADKLHMTGCPHLLIGVCDFVPILFAQKVTGGRRVHRFRQFPRPIDPHRLDQVHSDLVWPVGFFLRELEEG